MVSGQLPCSSTYVHPQEEKEDRLKRVKEHFGSKGKTPPIIQPKPRRAHARAATVHGSGHGRRRQQDMTDGDDPEVMVNHFTLIRGFVCECVRLIS